MTADDPFAHLHDEDYASPFDQLRVGHAQLVQTGGRLTEPVNGPWRLTLDLFDEGLRQRWYADDDTPPSQWALPRDYDVEAGEPVPVPSCWNLLKPHWYQFEGAGWYTTMLPWTPGPPGERVVLQFGGAASHALVFLNGQCVGGHAGASTPFSIEITQAVQAGPNRLQVMVENRRRADRVPMHHIDWFNYGGLYRSVELLRLPQVFLRRVAVGLVPGSNGGRVFVEVVASDPIDAEAEVIWPTVQEEPCRVQIRAGRGRIEIAAQPLLWSPASPTLHDVLVTLGRDRWQERIGFREIITRGHDILLNGEPLFLQGVCVHEDDEAVGKVSTLDDVERRLTHARELGANFLRLAHYPHHEHVARLADAVGVLLWAEVPVYWAIDFANPATYCDAENQLLELVTRDVNRASVILWGVGNENADTDARYRFMRDLAAAARAADPTRLITAACLIDRERFAIADRLAEHIDVIGLNEYFGWYEPDVSGLQRLIANSAPDRPVVISETGADAKAGHRGTGRQLFTEDWQAEFFRQQWHVVRGTPWIRGFAAWLLYDFRSERRQTRFQRGYNRKGLIAEDKTTKKLAFEVLSALFREETR
ncbi:MAG: glycoside hydrolase family 2 TIM barrel-domain containing protein [Alphaproteobacteria bacterium]|nr:glycoside hydrolase family 2 TIM barrel-domain containing protein [Alphaproteobacteria bacterium]